MPRAEAPWALPVATISEFYFNSEQCDIFSGYGAVGSALVWGARGREFKSRYSDQIKKLTKNCQFFYFKFHY